MEIKDLAGLSQPLTKFVEVVSQGIGILYEPTHIKRMAKARAEEIKTITAAVNDSNLPMQYSNGQVQIDTTTKEFIERTEKRMLLTEMKKQKNIEDIIVGAYQNLETEQNISEEPVQEEWINRFFNIVGEISSQDLQIMWSKILSEEIKSPNKCSIRTLEILRNISKTEAKIFQKISNYIIQCQNILYLPNDTKLLDGVNIKYGDILKLDEAQLINSSPMISFNFNFEEKENNKCLIYNDFIILCKKKNKSTVDISTYTLTEAGREIFNILSPVTDENFLNKYMETLKNTMNVSRGQILERLPNGEIRYSIIELHISNKKD